VLWPDNTENVDDVSELDVSELDVSELDVSELTDEDLLRDGIIALIS